MVFSAVFSPDNRLVASAGGGRRVGNTFRPGSDYDIRLWDLTAIKADAALKPKLARNGWLAAVGIILLVIALSLFALWGHRRQSRHAREMSEQPSGTSKRVLALECSGCGQDLKARADLAGKKVKCPRCGEATFVPRIQTANSSRTS
jgi:hypothetical protein